jgi:hypothetical protein
MVIVMNELEWKDRMIRTVLATLHMSADESMNLTKHHPTSRWYILIFLANKQPSEVPMGKTLLLGGTVKLTQSVMSWLFLFLFCFFLVSLLEN